MAFQKGQSGNPGGRPKVADEIRELARQHGPAAFQRVLELCVSGDERIALAASQEVMNRAYGKPAQAVDVQATHNVGDPILDLLTRIAEHGRSIHSQDQP
jgi:hypothetical protein